MKNKQSEIMTISIQNEKSTSKNNRFLLVWWSDNGWVGKCKEPINNKACKSTEFGRNCSNSKRGCSSSYIFKCYGMYVDREGLYESIESNKYIFFISKNPNDKRYYIIGYFYVSNKGEGVASDCKKWLPTDHWNYYIEADRLKSKMVYDYSNHNDNLLFNKEFILNNLKLDLDWNGKAMKNMSDDGKIGPWFKNSDKTISDYDAKKILGLIRNNDIDFSHPTRVLIEKALYELRKTEASKIELLTKLKEIVGRDGGILVDDETAWNEIMNLGDRK